METGGPGAHGGIIAREYGIPAVAGVADATTLLKTSRLIRVNGDQGEVVLIETAGAAQDSGPEASLPGFSLPLKPDQAPARSTCVC